MKSLITTLFIITTIALSGTAQSVTQHQSQSDMENAPPVIDIAAMDYAYGMPTEIPAGWVTFRMTNMGKEEHVTIIDKVVDSLSIEQVRQIKGKALKKDFRIMQKYTKDRWGGPGILSPGRTGETTVYLEPGIYMMVCPLKTPEGTYHVTKGMMQEFVVKPIENETAKPVGTVNVTLSNFSIAADHPITAGRQIINVKWDDRNNHDLTITPLKEEQGLEDVRKWLEVLRAPSPFNFLGGVGHVDPDYESTFKVDLPPGRYAVFCHLHADFGEITELDVPESGGATLSTLTEPQGDIKIEAEGKMIDLPEQVESGQWNFVVQNNSEVPQMYVLSKMKESKTVKDLTDFYENIVLKGKMGSEITVPPMHAVGLPIPPVKPGESREVSLRVYEGAYVLIGPLEPGVPFPKGWKRDIVHEFRGVEK